MLDRPGGGGEDRQFRIRLRYIGTRPTCGLDDDDDDDETCCNSQTDVSHSESD